MCGIFGFIAGTDSGYTLKQIEGEVQRLFVISESRGKEASGLVVNREGGINVLKQPLPSSALIKSGLYRDFIKDAMGGDSAMASGSGKGTAAVGHSRLVTDGLQGSNFNNQPVIKDGMVGVHNGIITNVDKLWDDNPELTREYEIDTEVVFALIRRNYRAGGDVVNAMREVFSEIEGAATLAVFFEDINSLLLATNTGSLYIAESISGKEFIFLSEELMLKNFVEGVRSGAFDVDSIQQVKAFNGLLVNLNSLESTKFSLSDAKNAVSPKAVSKAKVVVDYSSRDEQRRDELKRCTKCILPETMPFIEFDSDGVCNYCHAHLPYEPLGRDALEELVSPYRSKNGNPDCIVPFSGGRDSSYTLHYIKNELKMNPISYTYDWGMVTDLARRNQARICGKLGVENILISADIRQKRNNICRNIRAWLKRPHIGMVPLFMAGDKQYFYYADKLRRQTGVNLVFLGGNNYEKTQFKTGFMGVEEGNIRLYSISPFKKLRLLKYYISQYMANPLYWNSSLSDTFFGFYSAYFLKHDFNWLFDYIRWDETVMMDALKDEYNWEFASDTATSWRIGDGTAAFYNYIYYTVAGFTENDTFFSNQIRDGVISREKALEIAKENNQPRYESIREYSHLIGFNCEEAMYVINTMPKLY